MTVDSALIQRVSRIQPSDFAPQSLSIVVFGPGRGEAILVILPDGSVGVVDGCAEPDRGNEAGLGDPVRELLLDYEIACPDFKFSFACLTHPHADHYGGLGRLMTAYHGRIERAWEAPTVSGGYQQKLLEYVVRSRCRDGTIPGDEPELKGLERVFEAFRQFRSSNKINYKHLGYEMPLLEDAVLGHPLTIRAWAPHATDVQSALEDLTVALEAGVNEGVVRSHDPNRMSGALLITWGEAGILLAGDALCEDHRCVGWSAARELAHKQAIQVVNVAHHASDAAHDARLWAAMSPELAIVTPFLNAEDGQPPRPDAIARLAASCTVAITSPPQWPRKAKNPKPSTPSAKRRSINKVSMRPLSADPGRHAVSVSLDPSGRIVRLVIAEGADIYS